LPVQSNDGILPEPKAPHEQKEKDGTKRMKRGEPQRKNGDRESKRARRSSSEGRGRPKPRFELTAYSRGKKPAQLMEKKKLREKTTGGRKIEKRDVLHVPWEESQSISSRTPLRTKASQGPQKKDELSKGRGPQRKAPHETGG